MSRYLDSDPVLTPEPERIHPLIGAEVQWSHVDQLTADALEAPLFVAPLGEVGSLVIDGWHRIALARRLGVEALPALLITRHQASQILLPGSAEMLVRTG